MPNNQKELRDRAELECALKAARQHPKQKEATLAIQRIRALFWGNRVGKTWWGGQETHRYVFNRHEVRKIDLPCEIWVCCPSYDVQKETTQKVLLEMIPAHRIVERDYVKKEVLAWMRLDNGTLITFKSYESGREKFQGTGKRLIWFDEEPPRDVYDEACMRVEAGVPLDIIITMTPVNGMTWIYDAIYLDTGNPDIFVSEATWDDNPFLTEQQKIEMSRGKSEEAMKVRKEGKFVQRTGLVCDWWDRKTHLVPNMRFDRTWTVYNLIDFGWSTSKTCILWYGVDYFGGVHVFDGVYENQLDNDEIAEILKGHEDFKVSKRWADNQPDRIASLRKLGYNFEPVKKKSTEDNWDTTRAEAMKRIGRIDPQTGKSRLYVSENLKYFNTEKNMMMNFFMKEAESLSWDMVKTKSGEKTGGGQWNDEFSKDGSHNDCMDNFSYFAVMWGLGKTKARNAFNDRSGDIVDEEIRKQRKKPFRAINPLTGY